ncbi:MAG: hypothetical protein GXP17_10365 [Gammaproteobacteria bacterium]|nr:hypothetical protein [Gammaproteobacteria bacterium]
MAAAFTLPVVAISMFLIDIGEAEALPAFARKFQSNCALCHSNVPRLTPFGQKFLENGYQFPGTTDGGETSKIKLDGAQGPVTLDRLSNMMAVRFRGDIQKASFDNISDEMQAEGVDNRVSVEFPKIVNFFFGGTVTKNISYFLESEYNTMDAQGGDTYVKFERAMMQFSNIGGAQGIANVKVGNFDPSFLFAFPTHRQQLNPILPIANTASYPPTINRMPMLPYAFSSKMFGLSNGSAGPGSPIGDVSEGFAILPFAPTLYNAPSQTGVSVHGRPGGDGSPLMYQLGFALNQKADGSGEQRTDTYAMLRFDFQVAGADAQVSGFYYNAPDAARATLVGPGMDMNDPVDNMIMYAVDPTDITRVGIGARAQWETLDVYAAFTQDSIDKPTFANAMANSSQWEDSASGLSVEADWRFHPNWMFGVRYDQMNSGGLKALPAMMTAAGSANDAINVTVQMLSPILKYYPSPNIALYGRMHINLTKSTTLPNTRNTADTDYRVAGFEGQEHPASNLSNVLAFGVDMAF